MRGKREREGWEAMDVFSIAVYGKREQVGNGAWGGLHHLCEKIDMWRECSWVQLHCRALQRKHVQPATTNKDGDTGSGRR